MATEDFRRIFERKMAERQQFVEQFYGQVAGYDVPVDFSRKSGPLGRMRKVIATEEQKVENGGPGQPGERVLRPGGLYALNLIDQGDLALLRASSDLRVLGKKPSRFSQRTQLPPRAHLRAARAALLTGGHRHPRSPSRSPGSTQPAPIMPHPTHHPERLVSGRATSPACRDGPRPTPAAGRAR